MNLITPSDVSLGVHPHRDLYPLVTNPVSTRWSQPGVFSGAILMISESLSALTQSLLRFVILMVSSVVVQHSLVSSPSHTRLPGCGTDRFLAPSSPIPGP